MSRTLIALLGLALLPLACAGNSSGGAGPLRVQVSGEAEETAVYDTVVEAFEDANPSIDVTLVKVADKDDHLAKLTTAFAAGRGPDVFLVNFREYSQFVSRGAVEPFGPHTDDAGVTVDDYFPQPIEAFTYDEVLQCMPQNISSLVVYINRELFERASIPEPRGEWSWEEFRRTAIDLTR
jgi:multiple sugar transport system substrate-binding protein